MTTTKNYYCHRHIDEKLVNRNCPKCYQNSKIHQMRTSMKNYVIPCPKCGDAKREEKGGVIKTYYSKKDHFACGHCKISYNIKGECVTWDSGKDQSLHTNELIYRK